MLKKGYKKFNTLPKKTMQLMLMSLLSCFDNLSEADFIKMVGFVTQLNPWCFNSENKRHWIFLRGEVIQTEFTLYLKDGNITERLRCATILEITGAKQDFQQLFDFTKKLDIPPTIKQYVEYGISNGYILLSSRQYENLMKLNKVFKGKFTIKEF